MGMTAGLLFEAMLLRLLGKMQWASLTVGRVIVTSGRVSRSLD